MQSETIFSEKALDTIFKGELVPQFKKGGELHHVRVRGFRYEDAEVMSAEGVDVIERTRIPPDGKGVYKAGIVLKGVHRSASANSFFPRSMTREEILQAIVEAYESRVLVEANQKLYKGSGGGLKIMMFLDDAGRVIDALPKRGRYSRVKAALDQHEKTGQSSKLLCPVCYQPKVLVCPSGHWPPRQRRRTFYSRIKSHSLVCY